MYYEIDGHINMKDLTFDDEKLTVGDQVYYYSEIESLEVTSARIFAAYGLLNLKTQGKEIVIPFARSATEKLKRALRDMEQLREAEKRKSADRETAAPAGKMDPYEEMKKLKELLDLGIVTEEEFQRKKKELLGL